MVKFVLEMKVNLTVLNKIRCDNAGENKLIKEELIKSMSWLAEKDDSVFLGQACTVS